MSDLICASGELAEHIDSLAGEEGFRLLKTDLGGKIEGGGHTLEITLVTGDGLKEPFVYKTIYGVLANGIVRVPNILAPSPRKPKTAKKAK